ncbi:hypothetical protein A9264_05855 [Vibrio sp. UCD-FRSSP16_10]|uniref:5-oxoprolinase subunit PxpA n=1 Tax=unclassified Vibrio TaxID=2614977 RepID=UPI000801F681|nr:MULTISPECIES: 5-oxoprolinase subunit PxpA [unclassified Vibrio]OBT07990.1 hypothetical protein A9260_08095 [Vibrio sp. UCD-FRSSP16_30]OBT17164.1 hypothetical protein A9264_05855 [Vibrio sp. UCD-FRSSP16_10]
MKINCDMGESFSSWNKGNDAQIMPYIDMANIACGFHASEPDTMSATVALAKKHNVAIGAHPAYADLQGFGRRSIAHTSEQITHLILYQVGALQGICRLHDTQVQYIKPHGALYNDMMKDITLYRAVVIAASKLKLPLMLLATDNPDYIELAQDAQVSLIHEGFVDRRYTATKQLASRQSPGAIIEEISEIKKQAEALICHLPFPTIDQATAVQKNQQPTTITLAVDSLCIHGDGLNALPVAKQLRQQIDALCQ